MTKFSGKGDLTQGPISKHLVRLSVPMIWGILAIISFQLVDTYYISLLGTEYLAAISFTFPVTMTIFSLIIGLGIGMSSVLSRKIGGGNHDEIIRIAGHGLILAALIGLCVAVIGLLVTGPLFRMMGADEQMMAIITDYMNIWFAGIVFITVPIVGNSAIRATGDTLSPSINMMLAAGLNAIIGPFLIFGLWIFPRMEVQGAALATLISYILAMCFSLYVLYARKKLIFQGPFHFDKFGDSARQVLSVALPAGLGSVIQPFTQGVVTAIMAGYGVHAVAAFGVASRVEAMAFVIVMALATGMSPILGQNMGAGKILRVRETLRLSLSFCVGWSLFVAIVLGAFAKPLASVFSQDPEVIRYTVLYFWIVPFSYAAGNLVQGWASAFNALGHPKKAAIMIIVKMLALQIPFALLGGWAFGAAGVFASIAAINLVTGLYFHLRAWNELHREANAAGTGGSAARMISLPGGHQFPWRAVIILSAIAALLVVLWFSGLREVFSLSALQHYGGLLRAQAQTHFFAAALLLILVDIVIVVLCLPAVALMMLFAGYVFGVFWGVLLTLIANVAGAVIVFLIARSTLGRFLRERAQGFYKKIARPMEEDAFLYLLFMRPAFPFFIVNIAAAMFRVSLPVFILTTAIGLMPATSVYAYLGQTLGTVEEFSALFSPRISLALTLTGLLALLPILLKKIKKPRNTGVSPGPDDGS